ncbi:hypothetical protein KY385_02490 [Candidatus Parcubacteria bacterium]|nr:hypothetical protein [Candidatus Parcubacteria bacterium]
MARKKPVKKSSKKLHVKKLKIDYKKYLKKPKLTVKHALAAAVVAAVILLGASGWAWWTKIVINPERVLDDAVANSLQTTSVTRQVLQDDGNQRVNQISYLSFYPPTITAESSTELSQKGRQRQETTITTETIGTTNIDLVRYSSVEGEENLPGAENFEKLIGVWAKREADPAKGGQATFLNESLFSIVPVGNLKPEARQQLLTLMNQKRLYEFESAERKVENYRPVYVYQLSIKPADLIEVLSRYAELTGATDPRQFNPESYANAPRVAVEVMVDIVNRQILKVRYGSSDRTENYSGYNLYRPIKFPEDTITIEELQQRLQQGGGQSS